MVIQIFADSGDEFQERYNTLEEILEKDIIGKESGKLWCGEWYIECFAVEKEPDAYEEEYNTVDITITFLAVRPFWIKEKKLEFLALSGDGANEGAKRYPYTYPYTYTPSEEALYVVNDNLCEADFKMIIYGPRARINIVIGNYAYRVEHIIEENEYAVIDSRDNEPMDKRVYLVKQNGEITNLFNYRDPLSSIFQKIPAGTSSIDLGEGNLDLIIFQRRSELKWSLS